MIDNLLFHYDPTGEDWDQGDPEEAKTVIGKLMRRQDFRAMFSTPDPDEPLVGMM